MLNNHMLAQNLYYNYFYPNPRYAGIGYMDPQGFVFLVPRWFDLYLSELEWEAQIPVKGTSSSFLLLWAGSAPGIFDVFPNGFNKGPRILIFFKGF